MTEDMRGNEPTAVLEAQSEADAFAQARLREHRELAEATTNTVPFHVVGSGRPKTEASSDAYPWWQFPRVDWSLVGTWLVLLSLVSLAFSFLFMPFFWQLGASLFGFGCITLGYGALTIYLMYRYGGAA